MFFILLAFVLPPEKDSAPMIKQKPKNMLETISQSVKDK